MSQKDPFAYYDQEEKELMESIDRGERKKLSSKEEKETMENLKMAAKNHNKKKLISLRVVERHLRKLKVKAMKKGIPYQTYINLLISEDIQKA